MTKLLILYESEEQLVLYPAYIKGCHAKFV